MKHLISAEQLNRSINVGENIVIVDCQFALNDPEAGHKAYLASHIPGAHYLHLDRDLSSGTSKHGGRHPLPDFSKLQKTLEAFGANQASHFIFYDAQKGAYACRAWWLLHYCGIKNASVLNGGLAAWQKHFSLTTKRTELPNSKVRTESQPLQLKPGQLKTRSESDIVNNSQVGLLVDSRETARFQGLAEPIDPIAGHIPGAINLPWQTATTDEGIFLDEDSSRRRLASLLKHGDQLTVYCGSGVTACVNIFALSQLGINAALYPGSWSDWCSYTTAENSSTRVATD